jgi:hypothetical protein
MPHAFKQAPWRLQIRTTGRTALWIVGLLVLGAIYLAVNAEVARAGRQLLVLERQREHLQRTNAELSTTYAELTTPELMMEKAAYLGFRPARPDEIEYVEVEGYLPEEEFVGPSPPASDRDRSSMLSPSYTETLGDWFSRLFAGADE